MSFEKHARDRLDSLRAEGLYRQARTVAGPQGPRLILDGEDVLCLCSNNYLGLAGSTQLGRAVGSAIAEQGVGSGGSRLITGSMRIHRQAERALAAFVGKPESVLFSSGYAANVGTVQALATREDVIFSDSLNHASLIDGARLSRARIVVYAHGDVDDLAAKLAAHRAQGRAALVLTETVFSMDGDAAPLAALHTLARQYDAGFVVDEAHALGIYGPQGRGLSVDAGVQADVVIGFLGKAFGGQGAFVAASETITDLIRNRARSYVFSTAPAIPMAAQALAALPLVAAADRQREHLLRHTRRLREGLAERGFRVLPGASPILPVMVGDPEATMALSHALLREKVFAHGIRPPTVPAGQGRLRVVPMATHTDEEIDFALAAFGRLAP